MAKNVNQELIEKLISQANLEEAIELLHEFLDDKTEISILYSRFIELNVEKRLNVISLNDYNIEKNKIKLSVLYLAKQLENNQTKYRVDENNSTRIKLAKRIAIIFVILVFSIFIIRVLITNEVGFSPITRDLDSLKIDRDQRIKDDFKLITQVPITRDLDSLKINDLLIDQDRKIRDDFKQTTQVLINNDLDSKKVNDSSIDQDRKIKDDFKQATQMPINSKLDSKNINDSSIDQDQKIKDDFKQVNQIIKFKGRPINNSYFIIEKCESCKSSLSNKTGKVSAKIPISLYESAKIFNFMVYSNDTFLYSKKMRFINLDFNKY